MSPFTAPKHLHGLAVHIPDHHSAIANLHIALALYIAFDPRTQNINFGRLAAADDLSADGKAARALDVSAEGTFDLGWTVSPPCCPRWWCRLRCWSLALGWPGAAGGEARPSRQSSFYGWNFPMAGTSCLLKLLALGLRTGLIRYATGS
jgi:hypothetical protein